MNIALATRGFASPGGSETYVLTVAEQLQRLGHEVTIVAEETGPMSEFAAQRGHRVTTELARLDGWCESILVQDAVLSYRLAERFPGVPQLFRAASDLHDLQLPPGLSGVISGVVVCSDRVRRRIEALSTAPPIHRLRQPVDTERFMPSAVSPAPPRRALLLGNHLRGERLELILDALHELGIAATQAGQTGAPTCAPEQLIWDADFVVAKGRAAVEAMACGKPVFVYDQFGGDGWVTVERYPAMEADNFAGLSGPVLADRAQLRSELALYGPEMGIANRELAVAHHGARAHVQQLCSLIGTGPPAGDPGGAPLRELARLARVQWLTELRALNFQDANARAHEQINRAEAERLHVIARNQELVSELHRLQAELATRRVQLAIGLGRALDALRALVGRR